jgi:hypothetical protein
VSVGRHGRGESLIREELKRIIRALAVPPVPQSPRT